jgi:threonine dehydrogenase-like Zn-dependent dehydrogenase
MGHEIAGAVDEVGPDVDPLLVGSAVAVNPLVTCGTCAACRVGAENRCPGKRIIGCCPEWPGGFADHFVAPASAVIGWGGSSPLSWATFAEPLAVGLQAARSVPLKDRAVLVIGSGAIGFSATLAAAREQAGLLNVLERDRERRRLVETVGLVTVEPQGSADVRYDVVLDCVGTTQTFTSALGVTRLGGEVVVVGLGQERPRLPLAALVHGERHLVGSAQYTRDTYREAADWLSSGTLPIQPLLSAPVPLEEAPTLFAEWPAGPERPLRMLLTP